MNMIALLSVAATILAVGALVALLVVVHALRRSHLRLAALEAQIAALSREIETTASMSARTGRRVQRVEHDYSDVADRVEMVESRSSTSSGALDQAIDWARRGADSDKLAEQFGLSGGEAELVARLHGRKSA